MQNDLRKQILDAVKTAYPDVDLKLEDISLEHPAAEEHGDYSTNIALKLAKQLGGKKSFLKNIDWLVKNINKDNFENFKNPIPVGKFSSEVKKIIGAKSNLVFIKPRVYAKIRGWFTYLGGHEEINLEHFYSLPLFLYQPTRILRDKRNKHVYHFIVDLSKSLDVIVDLFYDEKDNFPQISSIYFTRGDYLKNFTPIYENKEKVLSGGTAVPSSWSIPAQGRDVAGSRLSSLHQNHKIYNTLNPESQPRFDRGQEEIAVKIINQLRKVSPCEVEILNGFINFTLSKEELIKGMDADSQNDSLAGKKIMVEFAHPNTHKELHIGHMRTLITGEALSRIFESCGAKVFRANYQGDVGPHVAKAIWGIRNLDLEKAEKLSLSEKAHLLGQGYVEGNKNYEENKAEIDALNTKLYQKDPTVMDIYNRTRKWSLDYYDSFYTRFYTKFDKLYFESEMADPGKKIVLENISKVFEKSEGAIIFKGPHTRVFITKDGNPTYEGKDMALAPAQFADFPFDKCIHVVANEQAGYFQVIIKALELIDPKFVGREYHLSMGMVNLIGRKISSRTGDIITVDGLIDDVKNLLVKNDDPETTEAIAIGAIKYSVLKTGPTQNAAFDLEKSVSLDGDSGPYLQYTYARARSVLRKANYELCSMNYAKEHNTQFIIHNSTPEGTAILRWMYRFPEVVESAAKTYSPNLICSYLFELAKRFNNFYNNCPILENDFRLALTEATSKILKNGLNLLGILALEKM